MPVSAIGAVGSVPGATADRGLGSMSSEDFFKILVTEMQNQDPMEPSKTEDMIGQVSQIRNIELSSKLNNTLDRMTEQQRVSGSTELIGKYVFALVPTEDGGAMLYEGIVTGVSFTDDGTAMLELDTGDQVRAVDVKRVTTLNEVGMLAGNTQLPATASI